MKKKRDKKQAEPQLPVENGPGQQEQQEPPISQEKKEPGMNALLLQHIGSLCLLFAVCGFLLGLTNMLTEERIAQQQGERNMGVLEQVLPYGGNYREIRYSGGDITVEAVYEAEGAGWVFQVSPENSYSGDLTLMIGVNVDGTVSGVAVTSSGESDGLGLRASEPEFRGQFTGKSGSVRVEADGGEIAAISGATVTSRAVCAAVNSALDAVTALE